MSVIFIYSRYCFPAPHPPGNLSIINITNSTISIIYEQPSIVNGELKNYKIESTNTATNDTTENFTDSEEVRK